MMLLGGTVYTGFKKPAMIINQFSMKYTDQFSIIEPGQKKKPSLRSGKLL